MRNKCLLDCDILHILYGSGGTLVLTKNSWRASGKHTPLINCAARDDKMPLEQEGEIKQIPEGIFTVEWHTKVEGHNMTSFQTQLRCLKELNATH